MLKNGTSPGRSCASVLRAMRGQKEGVLDFCAISALCEEVAQPVSLGEMRPAEAAEVVFIRRKLEKSRLWYVAIVPRPWCVGRSSKVRVMFLLPCLCIGAWDGRLAAGTEVRRESRGSIQKKMERLAIASIEIDWKPSILYFLAHTFTYCEDS